MRKPLLAAQALALAFAGIVPASGQEAGTVAVLGKGKSVKVRLTLPAPTRLALAAWLAVRG